MQTDSPPPLPSPPPPPPTHTHVAVPVLLVHPEVECALCKMFPLNGMEDGPVSIKRRRCDQEGGMDQNSSQEAAVSAGFWQDRSCARRFLPIHASDYIFHSENFQPKGETMYTPLREDTLVNTQNIEQFTFTQGSFFIGDEESRFSRTARGTRPFVHASYCISRGPQVQTTISIFFHCSFILAYIQIFCDLIRP